MTYKLWFPPLRKIIDYIQEKEANIKLYNFANGFVRDTAKQINEDMRLGANNEQTLCGLVAIGRAYQSRLEVFRGQKKASKLQKKMFRFAEKLDNLIV